MNRFHFLLISFGERQPPPTRSRGLEGWKVRASLVWDGFSTHPAGFKDGAPGRCLRPLSPVRRGISPHAEARLEGYRFSVILAPHSCQGKRQEPNAAAGFLLQLRRPARRRLKPLSSSLGPAPRPCRTRGMGEPGRGDWFCDYAFPGRQKGSGTRIELWTTMNEPGIRHPWYLDGPPCSRNSGSSKVCGSFPLYQTWPTGPGGGHPLRAGRAQGRHRAEYSSHLPALGKRADRDAALS